jgi:hypothetical protein
MTLSGETYTSYLRTNVLPEALEAIYFNNFIFGPDSPFEVVPQASCPGGTRIGELIDTSVSTNVAAYTVGDPGPTPDTTTTVEAYWNKDSWQGTAKTYDIYRDYQANGGAYSALGDQDQKAINQVAKSLRDLACTSVIAGWITDIDSTSAFSDASLNRTTYPSLASGEAGTIGTLAKADLDTAIESLENGTYAKVKRSDMVWLMPYNQLWNLADVTAGTTNFQWYLNPSEAKIDTEATAKMAAYGTIPIICVPDMTNTNMLLVDRTAIKVYDWKPLTIKPKDIFALEQAWILSLGVNSTVLAPWRCYKLDGITP